MFDDIKPIRPTERDITESQDSSQQPRQTIKGVLSLQVQQEFELHIDASTEGLGAVLCQEQGGKLRVISYASRRLGKSEENYPAMKLEFLCLKWAVTEKFYDY